MDEISGDYRLGESAENAAAYSYRLFRGPDRFGLVIYLLGVVAFWIAAGLSAEMLARGEGPGAQLRWDSLIVLVVLLPWSWGFLMWRKATLKRIWAARGLRDPMRYAYRLDPDALVLTYPDEEIRLYWRGICEIAPARKHWMVLASGLCHTLPRRFFADAAQERAFIAKIVAALGPDARARSPEAVGLAETGTLTVPRA